MTPALLNCSARSFDSGPKTFNQAFDVFDGLVLRHALTDDAPSYPVGAEEIILRISDPRGISEAIV